MPTTICADSTPALRTGFPHAFSEANAATKLALANLQRNCDAVAVEQSALAIDLDCPAHDWNFARDGSVTVCTADGWWAGCSLPLRAARQQLKSMDVAGPVACLLDPVHGAHIRAALDNLKPTQAVLVIVLDASTLPVLLGSFNFSADIAAHRLWIVAGDQWAAQLRQLFDSQPGLATPMQFVRLSLPNAARLDPVIAEAQRIFGTVNEDRSATSQRLRSDWAPPTLGRRRLAVLVGQQFRLGDDAGVALNELAMVAVTPEPASVHVVNADDPASGSTLALVSAAVDCGAMLTADVGRGDLPELLPLELPWLTWVTTPRIPTAAATGPNDRLLVADPGWIASAVAAGWKRESVDVAGWPSPLRTPANNGASSPLPTAKTTPTAAIVADTVLLDPPEKLAEFSSHLLLWNSIRQELQTDPLAAGADAEAFLRSRMRQYGVDEASLDRRLFVGALIWPAVMQGLAQRLIAEGLPLKLYGKGWSDVAGLSPAAGGEVTSRPHLAEIASGLSAIVDARPATWRNGLYSLKRPDGHIIPVVRTAGRTFGVIRHDLSQALAGKWVPSAPTPGLDLWPVVQRLRERS